MSHTKVEIRIKKIHCGNTEDIGGDDELYFTSVLTDGSTEKTQAEIVGVIKINDNETKRPNALIYSATLPDDRTVRGGIQAFDEDSAKDWSKKPKWVASLKDVVVEGLTATGNPWAAGAGQVLKWGYEVVDTIIKADEDDKLGERKLEIPVFGSKQQTISWKFSKSSFVGYSSWNYTVDLEILRTPVSSPGSDGRVFPTVKLGNYTIQQKSNGRFLDAYSSSNSDFSVVTRPAKNNDTQRWRLTPVGTVYTIQQVSNGRFLDAHTSPDKDFSVVTREAQNDDTQRWVLMGSSSHISTYTLQQLANGRYLDAHESSNLDFSVVTRAWQDNDSQRWIATPAGDNVFTLRQLVTRRFIDAHTSSANDFSAVTRTEQKDDTQRWLLKPVGGVYSVQQVSSGHFLDAHTSLGKDFSVVTRAAQTDDSQRWVILGLGNDTFTMQQLENGRFVDAHEVSTHDYSVITREPQNNETQRWTIKAT